jgi:hypothetical protein
MHKQITAILILGLMSGCSTTRMIKVPTDTNALTVIDYDATRRGTYILKTIDGKTIIVSEPSPDVAKEITASLGLSAGTIGSIADPNLKVAYATKVIDLASRSQTLQVLRESLFRLSEMGASSDLTVDERIQLFNKVLDTIEVISVNEFAKDITPSPEKDRAMTNFLKNVGKGTVTLPKNKSGEPNAP